MELNLQSKVQLNNGVEMPWFGLGVFQVEEGTEVESSVTAAIRNGYRSIDTAAIYGNEEGVGKGLQAGLSAAGLKREDIFVTSKVWTADLGYEETLAAFETSLNKLGLEYLDLYLIHWPKAGKYKAAWKAMETLYKQGKIKAIGVSNFQIHHLEDLLAEAEVVPAVNQIELHPRLTQVELREYAKQKGIQIEAWSPLMQGQLLDNEELKAIGAKYGKSVTQIILRWDIQNGIVTIPKSTKEHRIVENAAIFDFELSAEDMAIINGMNQNHRVGPDPDNFDF